MLTITSGNGGEFAHHARIAQGLGADFYFARTHASWERGVNENTNGLVRQYFPKRELCQAAEGEHLFTDGKRLRLSRNQVDNAFCAAGGGERAQISYFCRPLRARRRDTANT